GHERRHRDLLGAVQDGLDDGLAHVEVAVDVLDLHGGVVHEDADGEREPTERHDVDGLAEQAEGDDRRQDRERDGDRDDERAPPAPQEEQDHRGGETGGDHRLANHAADRRAHEARLVGKRLNGELRPERLDQAGAGRATAGRTMFCWPRAVTTSAGDSPFDWSRRWSRSTMIWRCLPPYGYGIEAPGTVTSWVLRKLRPASLSSDSESPDRASCRMGTVDAL